MRHWQAGFAALLLCAAAPARGDEPPAAPPRPNVIFIVLDACRADRMGFLGNARGLTPFLDSLAARAYVFHRAYAAAPYTTSSIASLFTSRLPSHHGVAWFQTPLAEEETTLAEVLAAHGYATGAFTGNLLFHGAEQGFDARTIVSEPDGAGGQILRVNANALAWLKRLPKKPPSPTPVFLYLHYMDTHAPYTPPIPAVLRVRQPADPSLTKRVNSRIWSLSTIPPTPTELTELTDVYDAAVVTADGSLRELLAPYWAPGLVQNAILVITADHGEDLGEHGRLSHGQTLYETATRVPLLILVPGQSERVDVYEVVSLMDVAPTMLTLLDIPLPSDWEGQSLVATMERAAHPWHPRTLWWTLREAWAAEPRVASENLLTKDLTGGHDPLHRAAIVLGWHKAVARTDGTRAYYDLQTDPGETKPDALSPAARAVLDTALGRLIERPAPARPQIELDEATRERLRALGYVTK